MPQFTRVKKTQIKKQLLPFGWLCTRATIKTLYYLNLLLNNPACVCCRTPVRFVCVPPSQRRLACIQTNTRSQRLWECDRWAMAGFQTHSSVASKPGMTRLCLKTSYCIHIHSLLWFRPHPPRHGAGVVLGAIQLYLPCIWH